MEILVDFYIEIFIFIKTQTVLFLSKVFCCESRFLIQKCTQDVTEICRVHY